MKKRIIGIAAVALFALPMVAGAWYYRHQPAHYYYPQHYPQQYPHRSGGVNINVNTSVHNGWWGGWQQPVRYYPSYPAYYYEEYYWDDYYWDGGWGYGWY